MNQNVYTSKSVEMPYSIRIAGIGGQGNVLLGTILSAALIKDGKWVVQTQRYGAQVRGGLTNCDVLFLDEPIDFPQVNNFDMVFAMHDMALKAYARVLRNNGVLFADTSMCGEIPPFIQSVTRKIVTVPITKRSEELFQKRIFSNIISLGLIAATTGIVNYEKLKDAVLEHVPQKYADQNLKALEEGYKLSDRVYTLRENLKIPYSKGTTTGFE